MYTFDTSGTAGDNNMAEAAEAFVTSSSDVPGGKKGGEDDGVAEAAVKLVAPVPERERG